MHPNLSYQLKRFFGTVTLNEISTDLNMQKFLEDVEVTYEEKDQDQSMIALLLKERLNSEEALRKEKVEQADLIKKLEEAHHQLLQSEKMASIGSLAAGVAHEINNPIGFVASNLGNLGGYIEDLFAVIDAYRDEVLTYTATPKADAIAKSVDIEFIREDIKNLLIENKDGVDRVKRIVQDLKDFSHVDHGEWVVSNLHQGLNSTLNIVNNELKYKACVEKRYGSIPPITCIASQLNQVFMNLLVNAAHAIEGSGKITIETGVQDENLFVKISDTGCGIPKDNLVRIFDPFFTTKPVGKGTGLGLSLSYGIVKRHGGKITVDSELGVGTTFTVWLPIAIQATDSNLPASR
ncbi:MAG: ATP-binding protein [Limnobacter sp.]|nr:ATP-binding protein [Limnobacter sp.]